MSKFLHIICLGIWFSLVVNLLVFSVYFNKSDVCRACLPSPLFALKSFFWWII